MLRYIQAQLALMGICNMPCAGAGAAAAEQQPQPAAQLRGGASAALAAASSCSCQGVGGKQAGGMAAALLCSVVYD
jgi:hypothetical protein